MADEQTNQPQTPASNGEASQTQAEPRQSLREIAEQAWNDIEAGTTEEPSGQDGPRRDSLGRFAAADPQAKPGEQSNDPAPPTDPTASSDAKPVDPAAQEASSNQPPQHWSEQDRQAFAKLPKEGQDFLLRRHTEMERDYQTKTQAAATAVQFTQALAPVFQHPILMGSLQQAGLAPLDAIVQWAGFHLRAVDPNPQVKIGLLRELVQRMGLDPAANGQQSQPMPGLSPEDMKDPAIRSFADFIGRTQSDVHALRGELQAFRQAQVDAQNAGQVAAARGEIDRFADEKDAQGNLKHPHFDAVMPHMMELYRANPNRPLQEAYDMAVWSVPSIREKLIAAERNSVTQQQSNERARLAVRGNVRGITAPVTKPAANGPAKGIRAAMEAAAEEVGFSQ